MSPARHKVLKSWGQLRVICGGSRSLHIAKLALEGPRLHKLLNMSTQHLHRSMQSMIPLGKLQSVQSMVSRRMCRQGLELAASGPRAGQDHACNRIMQLGANVPLCPLLPPLFLLPRPLPFLAKICA